MRIGFLKKRRYRVLFAALILLTAVAGGCRKKEAEEIRVNLEIKNAVWDSSGLKVNGTADLPDGASLVYELAPVKRGKKTRLIAGATAVENQLWEFREEIPEKEEEIELWLSFMPLTEELDEGRNPKEIYEIYGEGGSNIALNDDVETFGSGKDLVKRVVKVIIIEYEQ
ncbi:MAG: hypothetical protein GX335_04105 [Firmicutes bacterium]|nr:hypothetical protein [Bacillota bacterium]